MQVYLVLFTAVPLLAIEHCCKKRIVNDVEYTLLKVSDGDLHPDFNCLNNCVYRGPNSPNTVCFAPGKYQPKCVEASDHFEAFQSEAKSVSSDTEAIFRAKTEEYSMKQFTSSKDKLAWIKKDIENMTGRPFPTLTRKSYLEIVPGSKRNKFRKLASKFDKHIKKIMDLYVDDHEQVHQGLDEMEEDMLHQTQTDHELHQVAHHGVNALRLSLKLLKKDKDGNNAVGNMISAIQNNTDISYGKKQRKISGKVIGIIFAGEIVGGAIVGCVGGAIAGGLLGCAIGAAVGAIEGLIGAVATTLALVALTGCFSTTSQVETLDGFISLHEVVIGDFIRTSSGGLETHFTEFIGWLDRQESSPVQMLQVWTSQNLSPLTLTASHIVFTSTSSKYADELLPGDSLLQWNGTAMQEQEVTQILTTLEFGFRAPLTMDGTLLVDGYLTSCYASFPHQLSDISMKPVKIWPNILLDNEESQHMDGVRGAVKIIKKIGEFLGTRKQKITNGGHFPNVVENIVASFVDNSEF